MKREESRMKNSFSGATLFLFLHSQGVFQWDI
jgi:hypothetical protein